MFLTGRTNTTNGRTTSLNLNPSQNSNATNSKVTRSVVLIASLSVCAGLYQFNISDNRFEHTVADTQSTFTNAVLDATSTEATPTATENSVVNANKVNSYIVRVNDFELLKSELARLELTPTHELEIIKSVAVDLTKEQVLDLEKRLGAKVTLNYAVETASAKSNGGKHPLLQYQPEAVVANFVGAHNEHLNGQYGAGVTIGYIDTGLDHLHGNALDVYNLDKYWGTYDAVNDSEHNYLREQHGHGTHVASIAGNSEMDQYGKIYGVAPNALSVGIKAFDVNGQGSYADVIRGIQWGIDNKDRINLRVLNMSFSGPVQSYYWDDPLNQAIMTAWQAGIVVVASSGNKGPEPMTVGVPGNIPYIITVGAMTDNYTPYNKSDDRLAIFSSVGPTLEGFAKPEIIAPGGHLSGLMASDTYFVNAYPEYHDGGGYFQMSGTSQAAAVVSGAAAMLLSRYPNLSADDVKCRLMESAKSAKDASTNAAYSVFQQGAGVIDLNAALSSTATGCANVGLDIAADLAGTKHFKGPAKLDANGDFYIENTGSQYLWDVPQNFDNAEGTAWKDAIQAGGNHTWYSTFGTDGGSIWSTNYDMSTQINEQMEFEERTQFLWGNEVLSTDGGSIWSTGGSIWSTGGSIWSTGGSIWSTNVSTSTTIQVNSWVEQQ